MEFAFTEKIYKLGINACVDVPLRITEKMVATKGYIPIKGKIKDHCFTQTLVPVRNSLYRLYVNGAMLKGSNSKVGERLKFTIKQNLFPETADQMEMPAELKEQLYKEKIMNKFN